MNIEYALKEVGQQLSVARDYQSDRDEGTTKVEAWQEPEATEIYIVDFVSQVRRSTKWRGARRTSP
jgi:hypothetical protein